MTNTQATVREVLDNQKLDTGVWLYILYKDKLYDLDDAFLDKNEALKKARKNRDMGYKSCVKSFKKGKIYAVYYHDVDCLKSNIMANHDDVYPEIKDLVKCGYSNQYIKDKFNLCDVRLDILYRRAIKELYQNSDNKNIYCKMLMCYLSQCNHKSCKFYPCF